MNMESLVARAQEIKAELDELAALDTLTEEQDARFDALVDESERVAADIEKIEKREAARARVGEVAAKIPAARFDGDGPKVVVRKNDDPFDLSDIRAFDGNIQGELRGRALKAVETAAGWEMDDKSKQRATELVERKDDSKSTIAKLILATGSRTYKEAWTKAVTGREFLLSPEERQALARAMSLTDASGGFAVPFVIDPTLIQLGDGSSNPFRRIGRVETITNDVWRGLASSQVTASWDTEASEVSDDTPTWSQPSVTAHKAAAFIPASIEVTQDYPNLVADLQVLLMDAKDRLEATAFATGSGTNEPFGIVTAIDGTGNEVNSATTDTFAVADVYTVHETLGSRYRDKATWAANVAIINDIRQFGTADSHAFSVHLTDDAPLRILGRPIVESSAMDGSITALSDNLVLVFGDFSNYVIADRVGFSLEFIPHLFHTTTNRPSGSRGWYAYWRVGADSVNDDAFALLNVT